MSEESTSSNVVSQMDWDKCALCQTVKSEKLRCPVDSKKDEADSWYSTLCFNIQQFHELGSMPIHMNLVSTVKKDGELAQLFRQNQAKWHKSCRDLFSNLKLEREKKRKADKSEESNESTQKHQGAV